MCEFEFFFSNLRSVIFICFSAFFVHVEGVLMKFNGEWVDTGYHDNDPLFFPKIFGQIRKLFVPDVDLMRAEVIVDSLFL